MFYIFLALVFDKGNLTKKGADMQGTEAYGTVCGDGAIPARLVDSLPHYT